MIKLGLILTVGLTVPIILMWCLYYLYKGFVKGHRQYKEKGKRI